MLSLPIQRESMDDILRHESPKEDGDSCSSGDVYSTDEVDEGEYSDDEPPLVQFEGNGVARVPPPRLPSSWTSDVIFATNYIQATKPKNAPNPQRSRMYAPGVGRPSGSLPLPIPETMMSPYPSTPRTELPGAQDEVGGKFPIPDTFPAPPLEPALLTISADKTSGESKHNVELLARFGRYLCQPGASPQALYKQHSKMDALNPVLPLLDHSHQLQASYLAPGGALRFPSIAGNTHSQTPQSIHPRAATPSAMVFPKTLPLSPGEELIEVLEDYDMREESRYRPGKDGSFTKSGGGFERRLDLHMDGVEDSYDSDDYTEQ